jgi:heme/copper-type cytochrome/quinol oxidase subunit 3
MAVFLATETMLFAGLISAFLVLRAGAGAWPPPGQPRLPVAVTALNTAILLLSGYTMARAAAASRARRGPETTRWAAATTALGATFLLVQGVEWARLVQHGLRASSGPYGATFYTLVGCHGLHVVAAVATLAGLLAWLPRERDAERRRRRLEACRLYWLFVVAIWPLLYVLVYLA